MCNIGCQYENVRGKCTKPDWKRVRELCPHEVLDEKEIDDLVEAEHGERAFHFD